MEMFRTQKGSPLNLSDGSEARPDQPRQAVVQLGVYGPPTIWLIKVSDMPPVAIMILIGVQPPANQQFALCRNPPKQRKLQIIANVSSISILHQSVQFSTVSPGTSAKSASFAVTRAMPWESACAAINRS